MLRSLLLKRVEDDLVKVFDCFVIIDYDIDLKHVLVDLYLWRSNVMFFLSSCAVGSNGCKVTSVA